MGTLCFIKQLLLYVKEQIYLNSTVRLTSVSVFYNRPDFLTTKIKIETSEVNDVIDQMNITAICRTFHPNVTEYI